MQKLRIIFLSIIAGFVATAANAHPHVFVEANIEVVRNDNGDFTEIRHVWRFDELFSATLTIDFDKNGDGELDQEEIKEITDTVKESIAEYDFYTAVRQEGAELSFYEPEAIKGYFENGQMVMFLALELEKPQSPEKGPIKVSASDTSFYVAFEFEKKNVSVVGNADACEVAVEVPDFDKIYSGDAPGLSESFFSEQQGPVTLGDEFYSWASIRCS